MGKIYLGELQSNLIKILEVPVVKKMKITLRKIKNILIKR
jgi:hypothetical protein